MRHDRTVPHRTASIQSDKIYVLLTVSHDIEDVQCYFLLLLLFILRGDGGRRYKNTKQVFLAHIVSS